jgi:septum formation protein
MLRQLGLEFTVMPMDIDESLRSGESAEHYVVRLASEKAAAASTMLEQDTLILAADTTVVLGESILGKPASMADAVSMLTALSGTTHLVLTGVCVSGSGRTESLCITTEVTFRQLDPAEVAFYWHTGEPRDKAGSYGLQGAGAAFVSSITGSYSNVIGLPLTETVSLLRSQGMEVLGIAGAEEESYLNQGRRNG